MQPKRVLITALLLGLAGDALLHASPWGINALLWTILFLAAAIVLLQLEKPQPFATLAIPAVGAIAAAAGPAWRDSGTLYVIDILLMLGFLTLLSLGPRGVKAWAAGLANYTLALLLTFVETLPGTLQFALTDVPWSEMQPGRQTRRAFAVFRGLLISFPALLIFGLLFMSADPAFRELMHNLIAIDIPKTVGHILLAIFIAGFCGGFLRSLLRGSAIPELGRPSFFSLGAVEMNTAIAAIDLLFAAFVAVQFRYFFGGSTLVQISPKLTYAEYARSGFFELVTATAIVVPLLLFSEWMIDKSSPRGVRAFRLLALAQVLLVFVIIASALRRMQLYRDEYGLTELRLYTTAFMFWLAALLIWFCLSVLLGRRERFMIGALAAGLAVVVVLHAINPDDLIVRTNLARAAGGKRALDTRYATSLSADAVPALFDGMAMLPKERPCIAYDLLKLDAENNDDPRTWNLSRARAHDAIARRHAELQGWMKAGCSQN